MTCAEFLYEPLNQPKELAPDVWIVDGPVVRMSMGPLKVPFPTRMTIIALPGGLWLHSPIAFDTDLAAAVRALGHVRWLVAPSWLHYAALDDWRRAFPDAESWGAQGIAERAAAQGIAVTLDHELGRDAAPWDDEIAQVTVPSRFGHEVEFFHHASRTLILTDLIENFAPERVGTGLGLLTRLAGNRGPDGGTPRDYRAAMPDRATIRQAVEQMIAFDPARVILAHGDCYLENAVPRMRRSLGWALKGTK